MVKKQSEKEGKKSLDKPRKGTTCLSCNAPTLRKVKFSLYLSGFCPDQTEEEEREQEKETRERNGFFHQFVQVEEKSPQSENFINVPKALIEDTETGEMHLVDIHLIRFEH